MRNGFRWVTLRQQRVAEKLVSGDEARVDFERVSERNQRRAIVALFHERLAKAYEADGKSGLEFGDFPILANRHIELLLFFRVAGGIPVLVCLRRDCLQCEDK